MANYWDKRASWSRANLAEMYYQISLRKDRTAGHPKEALAAAETAEYALKIDPSEECNLDFVDVWVLTIEELQVAVYLLTGLNSAVRGNTVFVRHLPEAYVMSYWEFYIFADAVIND